MDVAPALASLLARGHDVDHVSVDLPALLFLMDMSVVRLLAADMDPPDRTWWMTEHADALRSAVVETAITAWLDLSLTLAPAPSHRLRQALRHAASLARQLLRIS